MKGRKFLQSKRNRRIFLFLFFAILLLLGISAFYSYQKEAKRTVSKISQVYLQEMSEQMNNHFKTNLDSLYAQIETIGNSVSASELESEEHLLAFLNRVKEDNQFSHVALISEQGDCLFLPVVSFQQFQRFLDFINYWKVMRNFYQ